MRNTLLSQSHSAYYAYFCILPYNTQSDGSPKYVHVGIPRICEYITLHGKGPCHYGDRDYPELFQPSVITRILINEKVKGKTRVADVLYVLTRLLLKTTL